MIRCQSYPKASPGAPVFSVTDTEARTAIFMNLEAFRAFRQQCAEHATRIEMQPLSEPLNMDEKQALSEAKAQLEREGVSAKYPDTKDQPGDAQGDGFARAIGKARYRPNENPHFQRLVDEALAKQEKDRAQKNLPQ